MTTLAAVCVARLALAATPMTHSWDTVKDVMAMHGKYDFNTTTTPANVAEGFKFAADTYKFV